MNLYRFRRLQNQGANNCIFHYLCYNKQLPASSKSVHLVAEEKGAINRPGSKVIHPENQANLCIRLLHISEFRKLGLFLCVQLNILELYSKAQSKQLEAPEVAWLESQAREFPYFGMVHTILARHHLSNKSTIKDRALLKSAAYARDRGILRAYLSDVVVQPKSNPAVSLEKQAARTPAPEETKPEEVAPEEVPVEEVRVEEVRATEVVAEPLAVANEEVVAEVTENDASKTVSPSVETKPEEEVESTAGDLAEEVPINWFLNMRIKLRTEKYAGRLEKIKKALVVGAPVTTDTPAKKTPAKTTKPAVARKRATTRKKATSTTKSKASATESATPETTKRPVAQKARTRKTTPRVPQKKTAGSDVVSPDPTANQGPDYEIGAFSSFTFLDDNEPTEAGESEIDSMMPLAEAVEFATDDTGTGPGQITFEEKDRIVEVTVSPEELERYFKGRLPVELNFSPSFEPSLEEKADASEKKTPEYSGPLTDEAPAKRDRRTSASELIERFIEEEPTISRIGDVEIPVGDLAATSTEEDKEWVTETLAQIYEKQGNKSRAIGIYEKLALRFPEKSNYFADLIQKLK